MAWESTLDRLILRQIHLAEQGKLRDEELSSMIGDLLAWTPHRPQSWFHSGYTRTLLGLELPMPGTGASGDCHRWFSFGRLKGHMRKGEDTWVRDVMDDKALLIDLLSDAGIASQILPRLMMTYFQDGRFEQAVWVLGHMEIGSKETGENTSDPSGNLGVLIEAALGDMLARVERGGIAREEEGSLRRALLNAMELASFATLSPRDQARLYRALGVSHLNTGEWHEAQGCFEKGLELTASETGRVKCTLYLNRALAELKVLDLLQLTPEENRLCRESVEELLKKASSPSVHLPEADYAIGILSYESGRFDDAIERFELATRYFEQERQVPEELFARARFYLASALLAAGTREEFRRAARLLDETLDRVRPQLDSCFYAVYDSLKSTDRGIALKYLDAVDLGRGSSPENVLLVALEYQGLGEPDRALVAAERVLTVATDLDQRIEAMKLQLTAHNMQGENELARDDFFRMRDLLLRRGAHQDLERMLLDEALVGQALDHLEIKCELADLYEEMEGKDWERAKLRLSVARAMKARKEVEDLRQALGILREVSLQFPDLTGEDIQNIEKLLDLKGEAAAPEDPDSEKQIFAAMAKQLGHPLRLLVVGGNERQRKHHPRLEKLALELGFDAEWLMANYKSPQKLVSAVEERLDRVDLVLLLHWNRHETTEPALEKARASQVPARTLFYAGFTSLHVGLVDMVGKMAKGAVAVD